MNLTSRQLQACMEAWLHCEHLQITLLKQSASFSSPILQVVEECATICCGTVQALSVNGKNMDQLALLCVGICEECAELCEHYKAPLFQSCAASCRACVAAFSELAAHIAFKQGILPCP